MEPYAQRHTSDAVAPGTQAQPQHTFPHLISRDAHFTIALSVSNVLVNSQGVLWQAWWRVDGLLPALLLSAARLVTR